jgi:hypothetical protein
MQEWRSTGDQRTFGRQERLGVEYLTALGPLTAALTQAQSAAVAGATVETAGLTAAVKDVADVDARLGDQLETQDRWRGLRTKIEQLVGSTPAAGRPAYDAYGEATDLLLVLHDRVQENSQLIRDPDADSYDLQDAAARQLPRFLVATGRFTDLAMIFTTTPVGGPGAPAMDRAAKLGQLFAAQVTVNQPAEAISNDLQSAVAVSQSPTLGGSVFNLLDHLRLSIDAFNAKSTLTSGQISPADATALISLRATAVEAAKPLYNSVLSELDTLIGARLDRIESDRRLAVVAGALAVVIALAPALWLAGVRLRARRRPVPLAPPGRHGRPDDDDPSQLDLAWPVGAGRPGVPSEREPSGAAR